MALNETITNIPLLAALIDAIRSLIQSLQWLVGGVFGLYLILIYLRWRESRMVARILREIRDDIKQLTGHIKKINERVKRLEKKR